MAVKTYGTMKFDESSNEWIISELEPHVSIKLKNVFPSVDKYSVVPFKFKNTNDNCHDLLWFLSRYPLIMSDQLKARMEDGSSNFLINQHRLESILVPGYVPKRVKLKDPWIARDYQLLAADFHTAQKKFVLGDDIGLGKTMEGTLTFNKETLPGLIVCQTHLTSHWKENVEEYSNLKVHVIKGTRPYNLPPADVYVTTYTRIAGWVDTYQNRYYKSVIFDEVQELRRPESNKYSAAKILVSNVEYAMGMSATPIYNYGDETYYIFNLINPGCLGTYYEFIREWCDYGKVVKDPVALGTYLREKYLFLRRTRKDVGRELPPVNKVIHNVSYDCKSVESALDIAKTLAIKTISGSFVERGQAARELDMLMRQYTGVSKAKYVAEFVKLLLEAGEQKIVLVGWHRDVYDIWLQELADYKPVMYTGSETPTQKDRSKDEFIHGSSRVFILSLRSGIGLDGLQKVCKCIVYGELDWSPKVHEQSTGRIDREGQEEKVTAFYCVSDFGSDPVILDILGLKSSQSHGIVDPLVGITMQESDHTYLTKLAKAFLDKQNLS